MKVRGKPYTTAFAAMLQTVGLASASGSAILPLPFLLLAALVGLPPLAPLALAALLPLAAVPGREPEPAVGGRERGVGARTGSRGPIRA